MTALLVSVRNAAEAEEAVAGGAAIVDIKEPSRGPLGWADSDVVEDVVRAVAKRRPLSMALGEIHEAWQSFVWPGSLQFWKVGLAGTGDDWLGPLEQFRQVFKFAGVDIPIVTVAYADWRRANAPSPYDVMDDAVRNRHAAFLIDTFAKDGGTLLDWLPTAELTVICQECREAGLQVALAGSLGPKEMGELAAAAPDYFAVRGAACVGGRNGTVSRERVAELVTLLSAPC